LGFALLFVFLGLEFLRIHVDMLQVFIDGFLVLLTGGFLNFANPGRNRYYTAFWAESIPILWLLMVMAASNLPEC